MGQGTSKPTTSIQQQHQQESSETVGQTVRRAGYSRFLTTPEGHEVHVIEIDPAEWPDIKDEVLGYLAQLDPKRTAVGISHVSPASLAIQGASRFFLKQEELGTNIHMLETASIGEAYVDTSKLESFRSVIFRLLPKFQVTHSTMATKAFKPKLFASAIAGIRPHQHLTSILGIAKAHEIPVAVIDVEFHQRTNLLEDLNSKLECFSINEAWTTLTENIEMCTPMVDLSLHEFVKRLCLDISLQGVNSTFALRDGEAAADTVQKVFERSSAEASRIKLAQNIIRRGIKNAQIDALRSRADEIDTRCRRALEVASYVRWQPVHNLRKYENLLFLERDPVYDRYVSRRIRALAKKNDGPVVVALPRPRSEGVRRQWGNICAENCPTEDAVKKSVLESVIKWGDVEVGGIGNANTLHQMLSKMEVSADDTDDDNEDSVAVEASSFSQRVGDMGVERKFNCLVEPFEEESTIWNIPVKQLIEYSQTSPHASQVTQEDIYRSLYKSGRVDEIRFEQQKSISRAQQSALRRSITLDAAVLSTSAYIGLRLSRRSPGAATGVLVGFSGLTAALAGGLAINVARYSDMMDLMSRRTMAS